MTLSKARDAWAYRSVLLAILANSSRDPKKKSSPFTPDDFDPFAASRRRPRVASRSDLAFMKEIFTGMVPAKAKT